MWWWGSHSSCGFSRGSGAMGNFVLGGGGLASEIGLSHKGAEAGSSVESGIADGRADERAGK